MLEAQIKPADLVDALRAVAPHVDKSLTVLSRVHVAIAPETATFTAMGRYSAAIFTAECKADGEGAFLLTLADVADVMRSAKGDAALSHVTIRYADERVTLETSSGGKRIIPVSPDAFPNVARLVPTGEGKPVAEIAFSPDLLHRFAVKVGRKIAPIRLTFSGGANKPTRIAVVGEPRFTGLLMPARISE